MIHLVQALITLVAAATSGNIGWAIVIVSMSLRIALLPVGIRIARRAAVQQKALARIAPDIERIKARFKNEPEKLAAETLALYKQNGIRPFDPGTLGLIALQMPVVSLLYGAISRGLGVGRRFLWIADLAKPDLLLVALTGAVTYFTNLLGASRDVPKTAAVISAAITIAIMWRISAALGLYWASSTAITAVQQLWMRRASRE
jgi:YidC/Oxa1 family membrane protein insertase